MAKYIMATTPLKIPPRLVRLQRWAKRHVGTWPTLYFPIQHLRGAFNQDLLVDQGKDICIDGYPRSANSFAVDAFERAQPNPVQVAHHTHVPAQILRAVRLDLPTVLLIRSPVDAVVSRRGLTLENHARKDEEAPPAFFEGLIRDWISYYETIDPVRKRVVIGWFEEVTSDLGPVIERVNGKFGTNFSVFEHTESNVAAIRESHGYHALPTNRRQSLKEQARRTFEAQLGTDHPLVQQARSLYATHASTSTPA